MSELHTPIFIPQTQKRILEYTNQPPPESITIPSCNIYPTLQNQYPHSQPYLHGYTQPNYVKDTERTFNVQQQFSVMKPENLVYYNVDTTPQNVIVQSPVNVYFVPPTIMYPQIFVKQQNETRRDRELKAQSIIQELIQKGHISRPIETKRKTKLVTCNRLRECLAFFNVPLQSKYNRNELLDMVIQQYKKNMNKL